MAPFDAYKTYLALKNHFTKSTYDYHKYNKKTRASLQSFYKRKDRFWFEKVSRQKTEKEKAITTLLQLMTQCHFRIGTW